MTHDPKPMTKIPLPPLPRSQINGWLVIDKPLGLSSAQVVGRIKRILRPEKVGHGGTLDPLATGILPIALGEATKTVSSMMDARKCYRFEVTWGQERDTDDAEGVVTSQSERRPSEAEIRAILPDFTGRIAQLPPSYSALKIDGKRAYALARSGEVVNLQKRHITIYSLSLISITSPEKALFEVECGKGTYIRSLARDFGRVLGCFGYVSLLRRRSVGKFDETRAISLDSLENLVHIPQPDWLLPVESPLDDILAYKADLREAARLKQGQAIEVPSPDIVWVKCEGKPVALGAVTHGWFRPARVFNL